MLAGAGDPIAFLSLSGDDWLVAVAVTRQAAELQAQRDTAIATLTGTEAGAMLARVLAKAFRRR